MERKIAISSDLCKSIENFQINDESDEIIRIHNQSHEFFESWANPKTGLMDNWYDSMFHFAVPYYGKYTPDGDAWDYQTQEYIRDKLDGDECRKIVNDLYDFVYDLSLYLSLIHI